MLRISIIRSRRALGAALVVTASAMAPLALPATAAAIHQGHLAGATGPGAARVVPAGRTPTGTSPARPAQGGSRATPLLDPATPGRVQQLAGQAGYTQTVPVGTTLSTTVSVPTLNCAVVPAGLPNQAGIQISLEMANQYVVEQSWCVGSTQHNQINTVFTNQAYNPIGPDQCLAPGYTATLSETLDATNVAATITVPPQGGCSTGFNQTWNVSGSYGASDSTFIGTLDDSEYHPYGGMVPYTAISFTATTANGSALGQFLGSLPPADSVQQDSVWDGTLQDQSSDIGTGSSFTVTNSNLGLPGIEMADASTPMPATGTTVLDVPVTLSKSSAYPVYVDYATADGTAGAGGNYVGTSGTLTFAPGTTTQDVAVTILSGLGYSPDLGSGSVWIRLAH